MTNNKGKGVSLCIAIALASCARSDIDRDHEADRTRDAALFDGGDGTFLDAQVTDANVGESGTFDADLQDVGPAREASTMEASVVDASTQNGACGDPRFVTWVAGEPETSFGPGQRDGRDALPEIVCGPPKESPHGAFHTASLGRGGRIVVGFDRWIVDGPGVDFIVFENSFAPTFPELATVEVSADFVTWYGYPCAATITSPGRDDYGTCAGWRIVGGRRDDPPGTWTTPDAAGGDPFDLADLDLPDHINGVRYVRITDRPDDGDQRVFDLDAVSIVNGAVM